MHVTAHLAKAKDTLVSFEILPPLKGKTITSIYDHLDPLMEFKPSWINVTYHRSETMFKKKVDGTFEKVDVRKRPGTVGICAAIMNHYNIDAVPHIICGGFTKRETEDALIDLQFLGIDNALILRGDPDTTAGLSYPINVRDVSSFVEKGGIWRFRKIDDYTNTLICEINNTDMLYKNQIMYHTGNLPAATAPAGIIEQSGSDC
jgi:hypothetical protein